MKLIVAITGASGAIYAQRLLLKLDQLNAQVSIVFSDNALDVWHWELEQEPLFINFKLFDNHDFNAPFASGSSDYQALVICPASMGTIGRIANGISDSLITRAADVMLKEKRKLIIVPREMPYNLIHIENMRHLIITGATIIPASPSFYSKPQNIYQVIDTVIDKILLHLGFDIERYKWGQD